MFEPESPMITSKPTAPERELGDRLVGRVVGRDLHLAAGLLLELLDAAPGRGSRRSCRSRAGRSRRRTPSAIGSLSAVIAHVTALSGRGSGRPPGPVGFGTTRFEEPSPSQAPIGVVVFSHPASSPIAPTPSAPPAAPCSSRRRLTPRPSCGCAIGSLDSTAVLTLKSSGVRSRPCTRSGSRSGGATSTPTATSTTRSTPRTSRNAATSSSRARSPASATPGTSCSPGSRSTTGAS